MSMAIALAARRAASSRHCIAAAAALSASPGASSLQACSWPYPGLQRRRWASSSGAEVAEAAPPSQGGGWRRPLALAAATGLAGLAYWSGETLGGEEGGEAERVSNWSNTHESSTCVVHRPESEEELEELVARYQERGRRLRPMGNALSPNGIGLPLRGRADAVTVRMMDKVLEVDKKRMQVRCQPGIPVGELCKHLRSKHGLVLENLASIAEQQVAGFAQIGAHGTGAAIPPVDEQVVAMRLVTPGMGTLQLARDEDDGGLFELCKCGLGLFGVVSEVTLRCVPAHKLVEHTFVMRQGDVTPEAHAKMLRSHRHVRYHWIPYTDKVVVTTCDPLTVWGRAKAAMSGWGGGSEDAKLKPLKQLLRESRGGEAGDDLTGVSFADLRQRLLEGDRSLDVAHVRAVNEAEAEYWQRSRGYRVGYSDEILQFDCGGEQWVLEMCFECGSPGKSSFEDVQCARELLKAIEILGIAAPAPIEQRWTCGSTSTLSPAAVPGGASAAAGTLFSWLGVIMYLPVAEEGEASGEVGRRREEVTRAFKDYAKIMRRVVTKYKGAQEHWAKLELPPAGSDERREVVARIRQRYGGLDRVRQAKGELDPKGILAGDALGEIFGDQA